MRQVFGRIKDPLRDEWRAQEAEKGKRELLAPHKREKTLEFGHRQGNNLASEGPGVHNYRHKRQRCRKMHRAHVTGHGQVAGGSTGQENTKMPETL